MEFQTGRRWMGRIERGADLWEWFREFGNREELRAGTLSAIGAVSRAAFSIYDQKHKTYDDRIERRPLEIVSCQGNYSLKDGEIFPHVHIVFSGHSGDCIGGHLCVGTTVFLVEYVIEEFLGEELIRTSDPDLGLPVWEPGR